MNRTLEIKSGDIIVTHRASGKWLIVFQLADAIKNKIHYYDLNKLEHKTSLASAGRTEIITSEHIILMNVGPRDTVIKPNKLSKLLYPYGKKENKN